MLSNFEQYLATYNKKFCQNTHNNIQCCHFLTPNKGLQAGVLRARWTLSSLPSCSHSLGSWCLLARLPMSDRMANKHGGGGRHPFQSRSEPCSASSESSSCSTIFMPVPWQHGNSKFAIGSRFSCQFCVLPGYFSTNGRLSETRNGELTNVC